MIELRKRILVPAAVAALLVLGAMGDVSAQGSGPAVTGGGEQADGDRAAMPAADKMTRKEKISWVEEQVGQAYQVRSRVQSLLDQARKEKDSIKISCLADKLTQLEVNLQGIEERRSAFDEALSGNDNANVEQQFTVLQIYISRVQSLMAEAENCVGEGDVVVGESETIVSIDEDITVEDPTNPSDVEQIGIDQPVQASAYY
jgi:hypothetical protein